MLLQRCNISRLNFLCYLDAQRGLREAFTSLERAPGGLRLVVNEGQTKYMCIGEENEPTCIPHILRWEVQQTDSFIYLGSEVKLCYCPKGIMFSRRNDLYVYIFRGRR